jgi:hypothetical protein
VNKADMARAATVLANSVLSRMMISPYEAITPR